MDKIKIENLDLYYGSFQALKKINLAIPEKQITAFIGPSGCGKSTLLKSLNRMNDLVEGCRITGEVTLDGEDIYGDMDISVIDEVPARRLPTKNCVGNTGYRPKAYSFIAEQVRLGHQAYVICPLVEESENMEGENVQSYAAQLKEQLPEEFTIEIMHGKLKSEKKNHIMEDFAGGKIQVLVSTTVVEVGVNVPNATVMMIENADHFGLAQLHQLRGRVGRGEAQSYCIMINTSDTPRAKKRLEILNHSNDGFFIASEDLKLRGPGDFFGIRQSGEMDFKIADIYQDADILQMANQIVSEVLEEDPQLEQEKNSTIKDKLMLALKEQWNHDNL